MKFTAQWSFVLILLVLLLPAAHGEPASGDMVLTVGGGTINVSLAPNLPVQREAVKDWLLRAATAISSFYGRYPVKSVSIEVGAADFGQVEDGREFDGERIVIRLGNQTTAESLANDWMITHEMFHLSQPSLDDDYLWMSEGMADYLEPVARVRIGQITPEHFWKEFVESMPQALPRAGDHGLDHTHTWASTYWGGCLYWLLADVRVREQTHNAKSVRDAALAALNAGGDGSQDWTMDRLLSTYDRGTGTQVFSKLHDEMGNKPGATDLDALWKSLGVLYSDRTGEITFDDHAPLAAIRRGITAK
jgi:hypothetical protein